MRVYLAATLPALATAWKQGWCAASGPAHAVTPTLRESYANGDQEELEYVAMNEAARSSLGLLAGEPDPPARRVVIAVDMPDAQVRPTPTAGRCVVEVDGQARVDQIAAVHVDEVDADAVIRAAVSALPDAEAGDDDAAFTVSEADGFELLWFARQEIPELLD